MATITAYLVAAADQHRAALRDLVHLARTHHRRGCDLPGACAGREVMTALERLDGSRTATLAFTAIAELAELSHDEPPGHLMP